MSSNSTDQGGLALRPKARILRTLGEELISNETVAVIELVKNAYDADAQFVLVRFVEEKTNVGDLSEEGGQESSSQFSEINRGLIILNNRIF